MERFERFIFRTVLIEKTKRYQFFFITGELFSISYKRCDNFDEITHICKQKMAMFNSAFFWRLIEQYKKHFIEIRSDGSYGTYCKMEDRI